MHDKDPWRDRDSQIRKLAETYRPDPQVIADRIAQEAKLRRMMDQSHDLAAKAMKLADEAIARMMRK